MLATDNDSNPDEVFLHKLKKDEKLLHVFKLDDSYVHERPMSSLANILVVSLGIVAVIFTIINIFFREDEFFNHVVSLIILASFLLSFLIAMTNFAAAAFKKSAKTSFKYGYGNKEIREAPAAVTLNYSSYSLLLFGIMIGLEVMAFSFLVNHRSLLQLFAIGLLIVCISSFVFCFKMRYIAKKKLFVGVTNKRILYLDRHYNFKIMKLDHELMVLNDKPNRMVWIYPRCYSTMPDSAELQYEISRYEHGDEVGELKIVGIDDADYLVSLIKTQNHKCLHEFKEHKKTLHN